MAGVTFDSRPVRALLSQWYRRQSLILLTAKVANGLKLSHTNPPNGDISDTVPSVSPLLKYLVEVRSTQEAVVIKLVV